MASRIRDKKSGDLLKILEDLDGVKIEVGIFNPEIAPGMAANEYGTKKAGRNKSVTIPERSWLRSVIDDKKTNDKVNDELIKAYDVKKFKADKAVKIVASFLEAEVKNKIRSNIAPPNAPATLEKKKGSRTLIDRGDALRAVEARIKK